MNALFNTLAVTILDEVGVPARVRRVLETTPEMKVMPFLEERNIGSASLVRWHEWRRNSQFKAIPAIQVWSRRAGLYSAHEVRLEALANLVIKEEQPNWRCDIQAIEGFAASKSPLEEFASIEQMVLERCPNYVKDLSPAGLEKNLAHEEIRICRQNKSMDHFQRTGWDGRVFLMNEGGSHHFAAAQYIARQISQPVELSGRFINLRLNPVAVQQLNREYHIFAARPVHVYTGFLGAMRSYGATFGVIEMPRPVADCSAVFLPKLEKRSGKVAELMMEHGYFNLGQHLFELASRPENKLSLNQVDSRLCRVLEALA